MVDCEHYCATNRSIIFALRRRCIPAPCNLARPPPRPAPAVPGLPTWYIAPLILLILRILMQGVCERENPLGNVLGNGNVLHPGPLHCETEEGPGEMLEVIDVYIRG